MMEVYDRVLPSRSVPTLVGLLVLALALYLFQGLMDAIRGRLLVRIGLRLDQTMSDRIFATAFVCRFRHRNVVARSSAARPRYITNLSVRSGSHGIFRSALGPALSRHLLCLSFLDRRHCLAGALILVSLTLLSEILAMRSALDANRVGNERARLARNQPSKCRSPDRARHDGMDCESLADAEPTVSVGAWRYRVTSPRGSARRAARSA